MSQNPPPPTPEASDALRTLKANASLEQETPERLNALAELLPGPSMIRSECEFSLDDLDEGAFALLTADSKVLFFVESRRQDAAYPSKPSRKRGRRNSAMGADNDVPDKLDDWSAVMSTVPTLFGGTAVFPAIGRHLRLKAEVTSGYYEITRELLEQLAAHPAWGRPAVDALIRNLQVDGIMATSPAMRHSASRQRAVLGEHMQFMSCVAGQVVVDFEAPADGLFLVAGAGRVDISRRTTGGTTTYTMGFGTAFGAQSLESGPAPLRSSIRVVAKDDCQLLWLPRAKALPLLRHSVFGGEGNEWFRLFASCFCEIDRNAVRLVSDLRRLPVLRELEDGHLYALLQGAQLLRWRLNWPDPEPVNIEPGFGIVLDGELVRVHSRKPRPAGAAVGSGPHPGEGPRIEPSPVAVARPGEPFGLEEMVQNESVSQAWQARTPARVVFILRHRCLEVLDRVSLYLSTIALARADAHLRREQRRQLHEVCETGAPKVVLFQAIGKRSVQPHLPALLKALAETIYDDFDEHAAIVQMKGTEFPELHMAVHEAAQNERVRWVLVAAPYVPELWPVAERVVFLHDERVVPFPEPMPRVVPTVFTTILPKDERVQASGEGRNVFPPNRVRLTLSLGRGGPDDWRREFKADLSRWARAVTDRRVGVALGGGGAWGYAHLGMLYHLRQDGIPIDMVSGASFGSVVGAFYAAEELEGLWRLLQNGRILQLCTNLGYLTYVPMQQGLDRILGGRRLEDLVVPFFPVTTDLVSGSEDYVARGTLGYGVRASGGLAPMMPPTRTEFSVWVDGGMVANVPAGVLRAEGARLVLSSNVVPPPEQPPDAPAVRGTFGQLLADLNPFARMRAAMESSQTAMATIGEYAAAAADVQFDTAQPSGLPFNMRDGKRVINDAQSNPSFWDALKASRDRWHEILSEGHR